MNKIDILLLVFISIFPIAGFIRGFFNEILSIIAFILIYIAGIFIFSLSHLMSFTTLVVALVLSSIVINAIFFVIKKLFNKKSILSFKSRMAGTFLGVIKSSLIILLISLITTSLARFNSSIIIDSKILNGFRKATPFIPHELLSEKLNNYIINQNTDGDNIISETSDESSPKKKIVSIEQLSTEIKDNDAFMEVINNQELRKELSVLGKDELLKDPSKIIRLLKNPKLRKLVNDPENLKILKRIDYQKLKEEMEKNK
ncbi:MAG: hypothetical protein C0601_04925 [Candidatus Muiribacterium halophilum]|uniref:CvpA family protein n=1 Tax=Muiribacterium halophilum TaxID=2053465 RepID=A0A2N5ZIA2_MUIH1|nr:MAG: hypothetical protein C0601_04925 [Candidatus Muirbacterium halophilum]